jgi:hypothetical protein
MTRRHLAGVAIVGALIGAWISPGRAYAAEQVEPISREKISDRDFPGRTPEKNLRVTYVEPIGARRLHVELNNGAAYLLNPCRTEDGRHCYWDADARGNNLGRSFVVVAGRVISSRMIGDAR